MASLIVGRVSESQILATTLASDQPELVAVYGRRRVGKTFLIRTYYGKQLAFELSGVSGAHTKDQLKNFAHQLKQAMGASIPPRAPETWSEAFRDLAVFLEPRLAKHESKVVVFLDELPWLASRRSGFLPALQHFWNSWGSRKNNLVLVVCGSAASWMIHNVIKAKGGLHNRITRRIRLQPFTLQETHQYLESRHIKLDTYQTLELYMAMGGIPHYLKEVRRGQSAATCIDRVCFSQDGLLRDEFSILYQSLFERADRHERVVRALAKHSQGLPRRSLLKVLKVTTGGNITKVLEELEVCGFIMQTNPFGKIRKEALFRLQDEYSLFFLRWIQRERGQGKNVWLTRRGTPAWRAWSGYAFESVCLRHVDDIKRGLGIAGVETSVSSWFLQGTDTKQGAQIDLVIDRKDMCINLCEMKFSAEPFDIDKKYAAVLRAKSQAFAAETGTKKTLFVTLITAAGVKPSAHSQLTVGAEVAAQVFFARPT